MQKQRIRVERYQDLESENLGSSVALCQKNIYPKVKRQRKVSLSFECHTGAQNHPRIISLGNIPLLDSLFTTD